uniref:Uncharacterized protein n=1 Tax=Sphaerodactylus townsendi TaxID=933632 RepID=A0ACB8G8F9_9SAUR
MPVPPWVLLGLCIAVPVWQAAEGRFPPPCDSKIYCTGELLRQVQLAKLFTDDKHFVDRPLKASPGPRGGQAVGFVESNFFPRGQELEPWEPPDWSSTDPSRSSAGISDRKNWAVLESLTGTEQSGEGSSWEGRFPNSSRNP